MAEAVVEFLEIVDVHEQHGKFVLGTTLGAAEGMTQAVEEKGAVGEISQAVVES